jgi:hypothetical protein
VAAERLCSVAEEVLNHAHENVWELEWDPMEEDPLLETAAFVKRFRRWQTTGDHGMDLRPGLEPQAAMGDHIHRAFGWVLHDWKESNLGSNLDTRLIEDARGALKSYWQVRQEGGPGSANAGKWTGGSWPPGDLTP